MIPKEWDQIKHFTMNENWGQPSLIDLSLVKELDRFRDFYGAPIEVTCGTQGVHEPNSYHYKGLAVDVVFPGSEKYKIFDIFISACRFNFMGVGLYPHWKWEGKAVGGLHLDMRPEPHKNLWLCRLDGQNKQQYIEMNWLNLQSVLA